MGGGSMSKRTVFIGSEWQEAEAFEDVTARMAALAALPFHDGYGKKRQPTSWKVNYLGRDRRIYCDAIGNAGATYIFVKGVKIFVH